MKALRRLWPATAVLSAVLLAATGCGSGDDNATDAVSDTFVWAVPGLATAFGPTDYQGTNVSTWVSYELGGTLVEYDTSGQPGVVQGCDVVTPATRLKAGLAESWSLSPDKKVITFKLRQGVKSAAGNELTSADVVTSFENFAENSAISKSLWFFSTAFDKDNLVKAVDKYTVEVRTTAPTPVDLSVFTHNSMRIVDTVEAKKHATADDPYANKWLATNAAYFGPWTFTSDDFTPGEQITLHANPNFFGDRGSIRTLVVRSVPDAGTRLQLLRSGDVDSAQSLQLDQYAGLKDDPQILVTSCASPATDFLVMNLTDPVFGKLEVRQAVSMALNREAIVQGAYFGFARPAVAGLSQGFLDNPTAPEVYQHNVAEAKARLAAAGHAGGLEATLTYSPGDPGPEAEQVAILVQQQLKEIGINLTLKPVTASAYTQALKDGAQMYLYRQKPAVAHPYYAMVQVNKCGTPLNYQKYCNETFDDMVSNFGSTPEGEQAALTQRIADQLIADLPSLALADLNWQAAVTRKVTEGRANQPDLADHIWNYVKKG